MIIGIDFDNTIACYDQAFAYTAQAMGLLPTAAGLDKQTIKQQVRAAGGEHAWMRLQGQVYGRDIAYATLFPGFADFVRLARTQGARLRIISHKSRYGHFDAAQVDLRQAACAWMRQQGFFSAVGLGFSPEDVSFHDARSQKLAAIAQQGCQVFIDDLPEVLQDPRFPNACRAILFAPAGTTGHALVACASWDDIGAQLWSR